MITWRSGLGGFVGASKRLIKGFFNPSYSVTSVTIDPPDRYFVGVSIIESTGLSGNSGISQSLDGLSIMTESGIAGQSVIYSSGSDGSSTV